MINLVAKIGNAVVLNLIQIAAGYILSSLLYKFIKGKADYMKKGLAFDALIIAASSFCGVLLPLGPFGVIPVIAAFTVSGFKACLVFPMMISSVLFNTSIPLGELSFLWKDSPGRIILAFAAGAAAGFIIRLIDPDGEKLLRKDILENLTMRSAGFDGILKDFGNAVYMTGPYLVLGAAANAVFHRYVLYDSVTWLYSKPALFSVAKLFLTYNATTKPLFLLANTSIITLLNLLSASSLFMVFRIRGVIGCYACYAILILLLISSIFIV